MTTTNGKSGFRMNWALLGAFMAACWSGYTTYVGMDRILGMPVGAFVLMLIIQSTLAAISWILGRDIARAMGRHRVSTGNRNQASALAARYITLVALFLLTFASSAFFSFNFYFTRIYGLGQDVIVAADLPQEMAGIVMPPLRDAVAEGSKKIRNVEHDAAIKSWLDGVKAITDKALERRNEILDKVQKAEREREAREIEYQNRKSILIDKGEKAKLNKVESEKRLRVVNERLSVVVAKIGDLVVEQNKLEADRLEAARNAEKEAQGVGETGKSGCGPICQKFKTDEQEIARKIGGIKIEIASLEKTKTDLLPKADELSAQIRGYAEAIARAENVEASAAPEVAPARSPPPGEGSVEQVVEFVRESRDRFVKEPSVDTYNTAVATCRRLAVPLATVDKDSENAVSGCQADGALQSVINLAKQLDAVGDFSRTCSADAMAPELTAARNTVRKDAASGGKQLASGLLMAQPLIEKCIDKAAAASLDVRRYQKSLQSFVQARSPQRDEFSRTLAAPSLAPDLAAMGMVISITQDLFILVLSMLSDLVKLEHRDNAPRPAEEAAAVGRRRISSHIDYAPNSADPPMAVAAKRLLRLIGHAENGEFLFELANLNTAEDFHSVNDNISAWLRDFQSKKLVRMKKKGVFVFEQAAIRELEDFIAEHKPTVVAAAPAVENAAGGDVETPFFGAGIVAPRAAGVPDSGRASSPLPPPPPAATPDVPVSRQGDAPWAKRSPATASAPSPREAPSVPVPSDDSGSPPPATRRASDLLDESFDDEYSDYAAATDWADVDRRGDAISRTERSPRPNPLEFAHQRGQGRKR